MFQRLNHRLGHYVLLIATGACLFLINLGGPYLWDIDEGRNLTASLEMRESGDWVVPRFNGQLRSHKPAMLYWLQVAAFEVFGVNEFSGRLPSALAAIMSVLLVYELGRRMFNAEAGLIAGLVLASSTLFCASAHFANPDALLLTFTTATFLFFWLGYANGQRYWYAAASVAAGLAVLAKGPIGLAPGGVVLLFLLWTRNWQLLFSRIPLQAILLCLGVALPWYGLVALDTKLEFLGDFFMTHNIQRAPSPMEDHSGPPWYYVVVLLFGLAPWSAFIGSTLWYAAKDVRSPESGVRCQETDVLALTPDTGHRTPDYLAYRFLACWIAVYLLAFTAAATKLPNYILPTFPAFALMIARFLDRWRKGELIVPIWVQPASLAIVGLIGVLTTVGLLIAGGVISLGGLQARTWPGLEQWAFLGVIPLTGAALGSWFLYCQRRTAFVTVMLLTAVGFLAPLAAGGSVALNAYRAPRPLVEQAGALQRDQEIQIGCYQLEYLPSLNFYVQRIVKRHQTDVEAENFLRQELTVFLFLPRRDWELLAPRITTPHRIVAVHAEMYHGGEVVVVTNH